MILKIFIIASGGKLCYSKHFTERKEADKEIFSAFLTAFKDFAEELKVGTHKAGEIKSFKFHKFNFIYDYEIDLDCMFVLVIDIENLEEEVRDRVKLLKTEFLLRYRKELENWKGNINIFRPFDEFVVKNIFIPPKILITGVEGVGKSAILNLFPGETVLRLDEDLNEVIEKPIIVSGLDNVKQFILREIDLEELIEHSKLYRLFLNSVDIICIITNSKSDNLGKTNKLFSQLKHLVKKAEFYVIANFQDSNIAFEPEKIEEVFGVKTFPFSTVIPNSQKGIFIIMVEILKNLTMDKDLKFFKSLIRSGQK